MHGTVVYEADGEMKPQSHSEWGSGRNKMADTGTKPNSLSACQRNGALRTPWIERTRNNYAHEKQHHSRRSEAQAAKMKKLSMHARRLIVVAMAGDITKRSMFPSDRLLAAY